MTVFRQRISGNVNFGSMKSVTAEMSVTEIYQHNENHLQWFVEQFAVNQELKIKCKPSFLLDIQEAVKLLNITISERQIDLIKLPLKKQRAEQFLFLKFHYVKTVINKLIKSTWQFSWSLEER